MMSSGCHQRFGTRCGEQRQQQQQQQGSSCFDLSVLTILSRWWCLRTSVSVCITSALYLLVFVCLRLSLIWKRGCLGCTSFPSMWRRVVAKRRPHRQCPPLGLSGVCIFFNRAKLLYKGDRQFQRSLGFAPGARTGVPT